MSDSQALIYCTNPGCDRPMNLVGNRMCESCLTPLVYRYLWATGEEAGQIPAGKKVVDRYHVLAPHIWLDSLPGQPPEIPPELPEEIIPYLRLYPQRLHVPEAHGFVQLPKTGEILLLENVPIDINGRLYPQLTDAWEQATAVRQVYWLWQMLELWQPLTEMKVAASLLTPANLRVEGWCVRLLELWETPNTAQLALTHLAEFWQPLVDNAHSTIAQTLQELVQQILAQKLDIPGLKTQLNQLLLATASELPLKLEVRGATDTGPERHQNEDTCYPTAADIDTEELQPRLTIVCDGIGGHEGGEVASQLAVQSLKLQARALITEVAEQTEIVSPELLQQQLEASLRVVNNVICARNDAEGREATQRMGTTLVMALQVPQKVQTTVGWESDNAHELYLINIGDSRAYWITRNYCQLLTVDDDVATREVRLAHGLYREALQRSDAGALTQALGTKEAEFVRPNIQRFIVEEDGLLLLCSDGLSDNNWVEKSWQEYAVPVLKGDLSLDDAVRLWVHLANQKNGYDNTSVVLTYFRVSPEYPVPFKPQRAVVDSALYDFMPTPEMVLPLDPPTPEVSEPVPVKKKRGWLGRSLLLLGTLVVLLGGASGGLYLWWRYDRASFNANCQQLPQPVRQYCPQK